MAGRCSCLAAGVMRLHDPQAGVGSGPAPLPRSGHLAAMNGSSSMIVFGGRSDVFGSFADVWQFSLADRRWTPLPPATAAQPAPRDHAGGTLFNSRLFVFGGRYGGAPGAAAGTRPIGDRWLFDLPSRTWRQLPVRGLSPLPRWLFSWAHVQLNSSRGGGPSDQLLIFGGEGGAGCALNDVWAHDLQTLLWVQLSEPRFATPECRRMFS